MTEPDMRYFDPVTGRPRYVGNDRLLGIKREPISDFVWLMLVQKRSELCIKPIHQGWYIIRINGDEPVFHYKGWCTDGTFKYSISKL